MADERWWFLGPSDSTIVHLISQKLSQKGRERYLRIVSTTTIVSEQEGEGRLIGRVGRLVGLAVLKGDRRERHCRHQGVCLSDRILVCFSSHSLIGPHHHRGRECSSHENDWERASVHPRDPHVESNERFVRDFCIFLRHPRRSKSAHCQQVAMLADYGAGATYIHRYLVGLLPRKLRCWWL